MGENAHRAAAAAAGGRPIIKVDVLTGEVLEDRLAELWAKEGLAREPEEPRQGAAGRAPAAREAARRADGELLERLCAWLAANRRFRSWGPRRLYRLVKLIEGGASLYAAARRVGAKHDAAKKVLARLAEEGIVGAHADRARQAGAKGAAAGR
ncbi:hypothetical protein [Desulfovirgula thermocuniculi]|uniref:hypothetical protein n=1 Tax=Desulfovirgula thermocuniculi TaxID=348842 RepID=UPI0004001D60|nr:hypothetical protein [Desulfovirgula thermocuniculi]